AGAPAVSRPAGRHAGVDREARHGSGQPPVRGRPGPGEDAARRGEGDLPRAAGVQAAGGAGRRGVSRRSASRRDRFPSVRRCGLAQAARPDRPVRVRAGHRPAAVHGRRAVRREHGGSVGWAKAPDLRQGDPLRSAPCPPFPRTARPMVGTLASLRSLRFAHPTKCRSNALAAATSIEIAKHTLLSCGLILTIGTVTGLLAQKVRIPDVAVFLVVGMLVGPEVLGLIDIKADSALNQIILLFGASYILFDGGASLRFDVLRGVWITIVVIATIGVLITAAITGIAAHYVLGVPLMWAALLGATLGSTDPATLVPIFRQVHVRDRVAQTVVSESALNDATGAVITFGALAVAMGTGEFSLAASLLDLLKQSVVGIVAGIVLGYLAAVLIAHERLAFLPAY